MTPYRPVIGFRRSKTRHLGRWPNPCWPHPAYPLGLHPIAYRAPRGPPAGHRVPISNKTRHRRYRVAGSEGPPPDRALCQRAGAGGNGGSFNRTLVGHRKSNFKRRVRCYRGRDWRGPRSSPSLARPAPRRQRRVAGWVEESRYRSWRRSTENALKTGKDSDHGWQPRPGWRASALRVSGQPH